MLLPLEERRFDAAMVIPEQVPRIPLKELHRDQLPCGRFAIFTHKGSYDKDTDARKRTITLRNLMNQASGLYHETLGTMTGIRDFLALPDPSGYTLLAPLVGDPPENG